MPNYDKQDRHRRKKSALYQHIRFVKYGNEFGLFTGVFSLSDTVKEFNSQYGDNMHDKHGLLVLLIKHYCVQTHTQTFKPEDIRTYYPNLKQIFGFWANGYRPFMVLFNQLKEMHFIDYYPLRATYVTTTRIKVFSGLFDKYCDNMFKDQQNQVNE